ncbi:MAG: glucoamylase family protein [Bacteroidota bacterium]
MRKKVLVLVFAGFFISGCKDDTEGLPEDLRVTSLKYDGIELNESELATDLPTNGTFQMVFSNEVDLASVQSAVLLRRGNNDIDVSIIKDSPTSYTISSNELLRANAQHELSISSELLSRNGADLPGASYPFRTERITFGLESAFFGDMQAINSDRMDNVPLNLDLNLAFSSEIDPTSLSSGVSIGSGQSLEIIQTSPKDFTIKVASDLTPLSRYVLSISDNVQGLNGEDFVGYAQEFYTQLDSTLKFPLVSDEELLTIIQEQTFKYFWDFAHPVSGLARERNTSGDLVTIGGSGFGVMAILVGIERGFITRQEGISRLETIVSFLETADRFHGVWPHWMNGNTGETIPFSANDDGADLVETAFMIQGLLTVRKYLDEGNAQEITIKNKISNLWEEVEWDWFTQNGQDALYWHWSPNFGWEKNLRISGWNESLIVYVLAAASPTHPVSAEVYHKGWARDGAMVNGNDFFGINLPLGSDRGGPLFFSHYSFLGLDPRNLEDQYANYWDQNINHSQINRAYCMNNPLNYVGYSSACWGLTASDGDGGYSAHSPNNDRGVITPTAAISALPYTPVTSMEAIKHFYYLLGDKLWGQYGFYDAFNITENWYASSYLAIDQGPIVLMIENHRTALLWDLFMQNSEVTDGLDKLGFTSY